MNTERALPEESSGQIPGEVLIELAPWLAGMVNPFIPDPSGSASPVTTLGDPEIDSVLGEIGVWSITRLFFRGPPKWDGARFKSDPDEDHVSYRLRFDPEVPVDEAVARLLDTKGKRIELATSNDWYVSLAVDRSAHETFPTQWNLEAIDCPRAWRRTYGEPHVVVAVIDSGVDFNHADLQSNLLQGKNCVDFTGKQYPAGRELIGNYLRASDRPDDEVGHGTHVAGTISCECSHLGGVTGMTRRCRILPVRVLATAYEPVRREYETVGNMANLAAGIRWSVDCGGASILNMSLGRAKNNEFVLRAIHHAQDRGKILVAAAGNEGHAKNRKMYPAGYSGVIAVGATDLDNQRAYFSNSGDHIVVCAPGVGISSTHLSNGHDTHSGTSFAAPHVSGLAALMISIAPDLTAEEVSTIIRETATPLRQDQADPHPNQNFGWGLINAEAALSRVMEHGSVSGGHS
ncbi:S8 family serine peptidase [Streptomyces sp. NBC_01275]|uniref:S8 family peptidase n=1 Tax=Streptomyces sp. NBC_01275 TaxID=2903807 RepID=UPI002251A86E|nr:S8 family serine peptidase [Streptomyces sp. NBC_01275]MCX4765316.1 S8 family serine peptidase [Streptomyces sp. NBC_01275]